MEDAAKALRDMGPALVVVTHGARGTYARTAAGEIHVPAHQVEVVDTVGAGDAFTSGLLFRLSHYGVKTRSDLWEVSGDELEESLRFASVAAAITCTRAGADPPRLGEIEQVLHGTG